MAGSVLRLAVVGLGPWGRNLARVVLRTPAAELVGVCDQDQRRLSRFDGARYSTRSFADLLGLNGTDALVIATPPESHAELVLAALARGLHVFVEKPMACRAADAREMTQTAERAGRLLMVGHILLYHPAILEMKRLVRSGELGRVRLLSSRRLGATRRHGCAWWSLGPHDLSLALALLEGSPTRIRVTRAGRGDLVRARLAFSQGGMAEMVVGSEATAKTRHVELRGTLGSAVLDDAHSPAELTVHEHRPRADARPRRLEFGVSEPLALEMTAFVHAALAGGTVESDGCFGLAVTRLLEAGEESLARGGASVDFGSTFPSRAGHTPAARSDAALSASPSGVLPGLEALA